jgi:hypothetical protein
MSDNINCFFFRVQKQKVAAHAKWYNLCLKRRQIWLYRNEGEELKNLIQNMGKLKNLILNKVFFFDRLTRTTDLKDVFLLGINTKKISDTYIRKAANEAGVTFDKGMGLYVGGREPNYIRTKSKSLLLLFVACELGVSPFSLLLCRTLRDIGPMETPHMIRSMCECVKQNDIEPLATVIGEAPFGTYQRWWWNEQGIRGEEGEGKRVGGGDCAKGEEDPEMLSYKRARKINGGGGDAGAVVAAREEEAKGGKEGAVIKIDGR